MAGAATTVQVTARVGPDETALTVHATGSEGHVCLAMASIPLRLNLSVPVGPMSTEFQFGDLLDRVAALETILTSLTSAANESGSFALVSIGGIDVHSGRGSNDRCRAER